MYSLAHDKVFYGTVLRDYVTKEGVYCNKIMVSLCIAKYILS